MQEETSTTSGIAFTSKPLPSHGDNWKMFDVPSDTFRRFQTGRNKFERWSKYLDEADETQAAIKQYALKKPQHTIVLRDSDTGAMRSIRRKSSNE